MKKVILVNTIIVTLFAGCTFNAAPGKLLNPDDFKTVVDGKQISLETISNGAGKLQYVATLYAPNHPEFPSTLLHPGETYRHTIEFRFSTR